MTIKVKYNYWDIVYKGKLKKKKNTKVLQGIFVFQERNCEIGEG